MPEPLVTLPSTPRDARRRLRHWLFESGPLTSTAISLALLLLLTGLDFISPRYITFGTFYLVVIAHASWTLGRRAGWLMAISAMTTTIWINGMGGYVALASGHAHTIAVTWSLAMRLLSSCAIIELVRSFRTSFDHERRLGEVDALTGILNRRAFKTAAARSAATTHRQGRVGVLAYIDLDGFKPINDRLGHAAGDEVLIRFAQILTASVRGSDRVGRNGGDEFVLFLDAPDLETARRTTLRLQRSLNERIGALGHAALSCSVGAVLIAPTEALPGIDELIAQADTMMYEAKRCGVVRLAAAGGKRPDAAQTLASA